ncbi:glycosyltransferase family 4 protein [Polynucleobacter kasalickyi]|uniref:Glycosyltransferase involved in cell wall bisynthesis n=1 Tax=Polynucleobacter kasalickyi TaxID=1938817 RepID=A0A1W2CAK1_9BURK|nr:glycosyltransferase family 4 protein [Polynucleobacter kasalickyi]SMC81994.1 Glycosyltransferase involved in cell wall bisynthesis [Polynucleobacter kasalickyi]
MRILLVHNFYGSRNPSGENIAFLNDKNLLIEYGHKVSTFTCSSDAIRSDNILFGFLGKLIGGFSTPFNIFSAFRFKLIVSIFRPEVIHIHNVFPLISPSIFYFAPKKIPIIATLHNYRYFCPAAIPLRNNQICTLCIDNKSPWFSLVFGCYRNSRVATLPVAISVWFLRFFNVLNKNITTYIAFSHFQSNLLTRAGISSSLIKVRPNFYSGNSNYIEWNKRRDYIVYVGRLSEEKGIVTLINAWKIWGDKAPELRIIGDGVLQHKIKILLESFPHNIKLLGYLDEVSIKEQIGNSKLTIIPSECYEGFPMVIAESFAYGTPVAVSNLGPLPEIVTDHQNGILFDPFSPNSLFIKVRSYWLDQSSLELLSINAYATFIKYYTSETSYKKLMNIYINAINIKS